MKTQIVQKQKNMEGIINFRRCNQGLLVGFKNLLRLVMTMEICLLCAQLKAADFFITFDNSGGTHTSNVAIAVNSTKNFEIDQICCVGSPKTTDWYVNGVFQENDCSIPGAYDPDFTWTFTCNGGSPVTIRANVYSTTSALSCNPGTFHSRYEWTVTVTGVTPGQATISGDNSACEGDTKQYSASATNATSISWNCSGACSCGGSGSSKNVVFNQGSGTCIITATPSNSCGNGPSGINSVTVTALPGQPNISGPSSACSGGNQTYSASASGATYQWSCSGACSCSGIGSSKNVSFNNNGTTCTICVTASNSCGSQQDCKTVTVTPLPGTPTISGPSSACSGESKTFSASATNATSYNWNCSGACSCSGSGSSKNVSFNGSGTCTINVTPSNSCGNGPVGSKTVSVSNVSITTSSTDALCNNNDGSVTATASGGTSPYTYTWNNGCSSTTCNSLSAGTYRVTVTDDNGCSTTGSESVGNIGGPSISSIIKTDATNNNPCNGSATVSVSGGTGTLQYQWSNGQTTTSATGLCGSTQGTQYSVTVTDASGCQDSDNVTVYGPPVGIKEIGFLQNLKLYPNPTTGTFTLEMELTQPEPLHLYILNSIGQVVHNEELGNHAGSYQRTLDLSRHARGVYLLQMAGKEGVMGRKIVLY